MTEFDEQIERIRAKLQRVRTQPGETDNFGAGAHRYELGPPIGEDQVRAFEVEHGVTLPDAFRAFITKLGHGGPGQYGGAGPYYGLYGLDDWADFVSWISDDVPVDWLQQPSPLQPGSNELPELDDVPDEDWPPAGLLEMYSGIMTLGTRGCTFVTGLVVTGESRGRVVYLDADHYEPPYVGRDADFLDWYERWLDEHLAGYDSSWFGYGPAGDESRLLELIATAEDPMLVAEAIGNLHKLPELSDAVWEVVGAQVGHESNRVRARAVRLLCKSPRATDTEVIASRWGDEDEGVWAEVIRALITREPDEWNEPVWQVLLEDAALRGDAYNALQQADLLSNERLFAILDNPSFADLHGRAVYKVGWQPEHAERLFALLSNDDSTARREAANALTELAIAPQDDRLIAALGDESDEYAQGAMIRLILAAEERRAGPVLLQIAADGHDFQKLKVVDALARLGDESVLPLAEEMLGMDRTPKAPGMGHTRTIPDLVRESLDASPSPKLRALGKVV